MDLAPLIPIAAIIAFAAVKIAGLRARRADSASSDVPARLEAVERDVQALQQELAETQERVDFAERLLSQAREGRQIGG
jgi:predicted  nucleic acid-binding Zn-ribbon protein